ncbi:hypothetical protein M9H77_04509 [Catharanthus roseus]|uniref:Uncharacterized protein n=1 Tax=Catharanthus roseus TaxID=4058 RepID=A0ACC0CED9_CATRO|nr:hypothetical protein M9H77_04509 [Catharanthus roseus]
MVSSFKFRLRNLFSLFILLSISIQVSVVNCKCGRTCDLAFASFTVWRGSDLTLISDFFDTTFADLRRFNPEIPDQNTVLAGSIINIPFTCDCIRDEFLGHIFNYTVRSGDTYGGVALKYSNLTTAAALQTNNSYPATNIPNTGFLNVTVNCFCGDTAINKEYGLFITYPIKAGDTLRSVASAYNLTTDVISSYNPTANFSAGNGLLFIPGRGNFWKFIYLLELFIDPQIGLTNSLIQRNQCIQFAIVLHSSECV